MEGKRGLILPGCGGAMRGIKIGIWRLLSHSNFGASWVSASTPIARRKKSKAMLQSRLFEDSMR